MECLMVGKKSLVCFLTKVFHYLIEPYSLGSLLTYTYKVPLRLTGIWDLKIILMVGIVK